MQFLGVQSQGSQLLGVRLLEVRPLRGRLPGLSILLLPILRLRLPGTGEGEATLKEIGWRPALLPCFVQSSG